MRKKYQVEIHEPLEYEDMAPMLAGIEDEGGNSQLDEIRAKSGNPVGSTKLEITMGHGKKREIRRCLQRFRYKVKTRAESQLEESDWVNFLSAPTET